jgi:outer membrane protein OmpA-like peptidoglycan-associated protein
MSFNLLDAVKGHLGGDLVSKAASFLGENESGVSKAVNGLLPTVLTGLASKASTSSGAEEVASMASDAHNSGILGSIGSMFGGGDLLSKGADLVKGIFGGNASGIIDGIASFAGLKSGSASSLLSMLAPVALGTIGKHSAENGLGASGIASMLSSQSSSWSSLLPSGLGSLLGGGSVASAVSSLTGAAKGVGGSAVNMAEEAVSTASGGIKWLLPLLLLGGLGFLAYWLLNNKGKSADAHASGSANASATAVAAAAKPNISVDSATGIVKYDLGAATDIELPGGVKLTGVAKDGFENTLVNFIKTGKIDTVNKKANWFTLHDVQFKTNSTAYASDAAMTQVKNVGAILKAYPNVSLKVGGYTDFTGDAAKNKTLSDQRAKQLQKDLLANGAAAGQIVEAVGYGSDHAECKDKNDKLGLARDRKTAAKVDKM